MAPFTPTYTCPDCGKIYKAKETLTRHRKNHEASSQYSCHLCANTFKRKDLLTRHVATHEGKENGQLRARRSNNSACERCSSRKLRCDGLAPCSKCASAPEQCVYRANQDFPAPGDESIEAEGSVTAFSQSDLRTDPVVPSMNDGMPAFGHQQVSEPVWGSNDYYNGMTFDNAAWPWMHEAMYMQSNSTWSAMNQQLERAQVMPMDLSTPQPTTNLANINDTYNATGDSATQVLGDLHSNSGRPILESQRPSGQPSSTSMHDDLADPPDPSNLDADPKTFSRPSTPELTSRREAVLDETVKYSLDYAADPSFGIWDRSHTSAKVFEVFDLARVGVAPDRVLDYFVELYFENFHLLWPFFHQKTLQTVHRDAPYLFLTLSAVGSAFAGNVAWTYHTILLNALRKILPAACFSDSMPDHQLEPLAGSLELVRISYMYFGHARALTAVQMIGGALIYLSKKLDLFGGALLSGELPFETNHRIGSPQWIRSETRKHLAAGMLMLENDVSLLFGARPLVSAEEFGISLPSSHGVWTSESPSPPVLAEEEPAKPLFSHLVHIALDLNEPYPNVDPFAMKMIMHGLQDHVWRYSYEHGFMYQFQDNARGIAPLRRSPSSSMTSDFLDHSRRPMREYWKGRENLVKVLDRWKQTLAANALPQHAKSQRSSLLAGHLLFHLSFMKIHAPLSAIHRLFLDTTQQNVNNSAVNMIREWANAEDASKSVHHALTVRALLQAELDRDKHGRAKFMALSQLGMFHAAAILWAVAGARNESDLTVFDPLVGQDIRINRAENAELMRSYADVLKNIGRQWYGMSSIQATVNDMASVNFP